MIDVTNIAELIGVPVVGVYVLIGMAILVTYLIHSSIPNKENQIKFLGVVGLLSVLLLYFSGAVDLGGKDVQVDINTFNESLEWQETYQKQAEIELTDYQGFIANTEYYNYNDPVIEEIANDIRSQSTTSEEAIANTLNYVFDNIEYVYESDDACYNSDAPEIIKNGKGQCDTQSIVVISILRKLGIAAKPVGGCIMLNPQCGLQSMLLNSLQGLQGIPRFSELDQVSKDQETFSRSLFSASRQGGLHAWATAWIPDKGWVVLESTAGEYGDTRCYYYHVELIPEDENKDDICVSKSWEYSKACMINEIDTLNQYGLGLSDEVTP